VIVLCVCVRVAYVHPKKVICEMEIKIAFAREVSCTKDSPAFYLTAHVIIHE
jgi:hypothetical protein